MQKWFFNKYREYHHLMFHVTNCKLEAKSKKKEERKKNQMNSKIRFFLSSLFLLVLWMENDEYYTPFLFGSVYFSIYCCHNLSCDAFDEK